VRKHTDKITPLVVMNLLQEFIDYHTQCSSHAQFILVVYSKGESTKMLGLNWALALEVGVHILTIHLMVTL